jgi:hypothetical protein
MPLANPLVIPRPDAGSHRKEYRQRQFKIPPVSARFFFANPKLWKKANTKNDQRMTKGSPEAISL